jgi:hypothetical protein
MNRLIFASSALLIAAPAYARECSAPPVRTSDQALCYALAYANKNGLSNAPALKKSVTKGRTVWTVRAVDTRRETKGAGWEVEVDPASGTVTRFKGYKSPEAARR